MTAFGIMAQHRYSKGREVLDDDRGRQMGEFVCLHQSKLLEGIV